MVRLLIVFCAVSVLHFVLCVVGVALALPAAFAYQHGFWAAPVKITLAWIGGVLIAPIGLSRPRARCSAIWRSPR